MDLKRLKYFCTVFEQGSIVGAAKILNMAHPPLSKRLQELEEEVGAPLFLRNVRGVAPTEAGFYLYRKACEILRNVDEMRRETAKFAHMEKKTVKVGLSYLFKSLFTPFITELQASNRDVMLSVSVSDSSHLELLLNHGAVDLAFVQAPWRSENYTQISFPRIPVVAVVSRDLLPSPDKTSITVEELGHFPLIILRRIEGPGTCEAILDQLRKSGIQANVLMHVSEPSLVVDMLENGLCAAALLPACEVDEKALKRSRLLDITPAPMSFLPSMIRLASAAPIEAVSTLLAKWQPILAPGGKHI